MDESIPVNPVGRSPRRFWLWVVWGLLLVTFSYKRKILGEAGVRPWYLPGVALSCLWLAWVLVRYPWLRRLGWRVRLEPALIGLVYGLIGYVLVQSAWYPESVRPMLYTAATVFLLFTLALMTIGAAGWQDFMLGMTRLLLWYGLVNIGLVVAAWMWPDRMSFILVPEEESGFGARVSGLPGDPTHFGSFLAIALLLWFVLRRQLARGWQLGAAILLVAMFATGTRNALLSLLVGVTVATLVGPRGSSVRFMKLSAILAVAGVAGLWAFSHTSYGLAFLADLFRVTDENAYSRLAIWRHMAGLAAGLPPGQQLFGGGYLYIQDVFGSPYNAVLRLYFNQGLLFAGAFLLLVAGVAVLGLLDREVVRRQTMLALLAYWFSFSLFLDTAFAEFFHATELCLWLAAALGVTRTLQVSSRPSNLVPA